MRPLTSNPKGKIQFKEYDIRAMGLNLSETLLHDKVVFSKATQKLVYIYYEKLDKNLKKREIELENAKAKLDRLYKNKRKIFGDGLLEAVTKLVGGSN